MKTESFLPSGLDMKLKGKLSILLLTSTFLLLTSSLEVSSQTEGYRLRPEDVKELSIFAGGEVQANTMLTVSPEGTIACPFLGDIKANSLTIGELMKKIREPLSKDYFVNPQVIISIKEYRGPEWSIYVLGHVKNPGAYAYREGLTALDACILAGGFAEFAAPNRTTITQREDGKTKVIKINLNKVRQGKLEDIPLRPGDRIDVPESRL